MISPASATLSPTDVARRIGVSKETVRRWVELGKLQPQVRTLGGRIRFSPEAVAELERRLIVEPSVSPA